MSLTDRQQKILAFVNKCVCEKSRRPTIREIGMAVGISSLSVIDYNIRILQQMGLLPSEKIPIFGGGLWSKPAS